MKQFIVNKKYMGRMIGNADCTFTFKVINRTAKRITLKDDSDIITVGVKISADGSEYCLPLGNYSKAPVLRAEREIN